MPRSRALLALLLAVTWCTAAWHADLEAIGLMLEHEHRVHDGHGHAHHHHAPVEAYDHHEDFFARDVAKDQLRVVAVSGLWIALVGCACWLAAHVRPRRVPERPARPRWETGTPAGWLFVQRCAPAATAPPLWG